MQNVTIIGAGPAGVLLAHYLLERPNYRVELYDRRPDPRRTDFTHHRSFPLSLQERGRRALRGIEGLERAIAAQSVFCNGTAIYQRNGQARTIERKNPVLTIDRNRLVAVLLEQLTQKYDRDRLHLGFNSCCLRVDPATQTVTLQEEGGKLWNTHYDLLVGADGARSAVREFLQDREGFECEQEYVIDAYKSLFLSRLNPDKTVDLAPDKIHTWRSKTGQRAILVPQPDNTLNGVIIFEAENNPLASFSTPKDVLTFFEQFFPPLDRLMSAEEAEALLQRPVAKVLTVRCDRFHWGDRILLVGDAAHAVSPSIGQGCNAALEDVWIVAQLLDRYGENWQQVLPAFSDRRVPDAHALRELSDYSFPRNKFLVVEFFIRLAGKRFLHNLFPQQFQPFLFDLVLDTAMPYAEVERRYRGWLAKVKRSMESS